MKPIYRLRVSRAWWIIANRWFGYKFWAPRNKNGIDGGIQGVQIIGPLFRISATEDCHTTGAALRYVDPDLLA